MTETSGFLFPSLNIIINQYDFNIRHIIKKKSLKVIPLENKPNFQIAIFGTFIFPKIKIFSRNYLIIVFSIYANK
jgi:hypothetical protein